jgi:hypothetical protein
VTCHVGDVVIFVGADQDVPAPLESQALYQIISNPTEAGKPGHLLFSVRYYGGGGRFSIVDGCIERPTFSRQNLNEFSEEFTMVKIQPCTSLGRGHVAGEFWLQTSFPPPSIDDYIMFWGSPPPYLLSLSSSVFKVGCIRQQAEHAGSNSFQFSVLPVEVGEVGGLGSASGAEAGEGVFAFARAVSVDAIFRPESLGGGEGRRERGLTNVADIDERRKDDKRRALGYNGSASKRRRKDSDLSTPPPYYNIPRRVYLRTSVSLSSHMQKKLQFTEQDGKGGHCVFHFFVPDTVADGGGYSWKLFKVIQRDSRIVCAAKLHNL